LSPFGKSLWPGQTSDVSLAARSIDVASSDTSKMAPGGLTTNREKNISTIRVTITHLANN
jgi:hypothetical protein